MKGLGFCQSTAVEFWVCKLALLKGVVDLLYTPTLLWYIEAELAGKRPRGGARSVANLSMHQTMALDFLQSTGRFPGPWAC